MKRNGWQILTDPDTFPVTTDLSSKMQFPHLPDSRPGIRTQVVNGPPKVWQKAQRSASLPRCLVVGLQLLTWLAGKLLARLDDNCWNETLCLAGEYMFEALT
jgi:hypothetical protein